ncbi:hypothetical protein L218DRAFT_952651 [Marasmius fiardii PR-910]|nr:hypothetical protein L218DRAFT_952651 [Marasmius fiardii PR-910]
MSNVNVVEFYDIASKDGGTTSPNAFKTRYSLHFKGVPYKRIVVEYPDIKTVCEKIGATPTMKKPDGTPFYTLPAIRDLLTGVVISDSMCIAEYLDEQYPDKPTLIPDGTLALHKAYNDAFGAKFLNMIPLMLPKVPPTLNPLSQEYYERTRKEMFGMTLAELYPKDPDAQWKKVEADFEVVAGWFKEDEFIGGDRPIFADFVTASFVLFVRNVYGADSPEWKNLGGSFQSGRWGRLVENLKQYE